jgi:nicotinamidase-related amidase
MNGLSTLQPKFGALALNQATKQQLLEALRNNDVLVVDVDSQEDFFRFTIPGATPEERTGLPVPGAGEKQGEGIRPNLARLTSELVKEQGIPRLATRDTMAPGDAEFGLFTAISAQHCVKGTEGWEKIPETVIPGEATATVDVPTNGRDTQDVPTRAMLQKLSTVVLNKNSFSFDRRRRSAQDSPDKTFNNPKADLLLQRWGKKFAIVYGVATDFCVQGALEALKKRGITPFVVSDAVKAVDSQKDALLSTDPAGPYAKDPVYGDVTVLSTDELLAIVRQTR